MEIKARPRYIISEKIFSNKREKIVRGDTDLIRFDEYGYGAIDKV